MYGALASVSLVALAIFVLANRPMAKKLKITFYLNVNFLVNNDSKIEKNGTPKV
jgi:hypothetical protein